MKRGIIFLVLWLLVTFVIGSLFVEPHPPGGVSWPYYFFMALVPFGALEYARFGCRVSLVICYGLFGGYIFAFPLFFDGFVLRYGYVTAESILLRIGICTLLMPLVCVGTFMAGRSFFKRDKKTLA